jgi:hypothetical protein
MMGIEVEQPLALGADEIVRRRRAATVYAKRWNGQFLMDKS